MALPSFQPTTEWVVVGNALNENTDVVSIYGNKIIVSSK